MINDLIKKATGGLDGIVDELLKSAKGKIKEKISKSFTIKKLQFLKDNIKSVGNVKTLINPDSIVKLNYIFFDDAISFNGKKYISSSSFGSKQILIEGGPGQGKSLYLRWLCLKEGANSNLIPIFIEFRNLKFEKSLKEELIEAINEFGVSLDDSLFDFLARSEKIVFILDGFDEVPSKDRLRIARELEIIVRGYPELRIIMSSRPDSGMGASFYFRKFKITPMSLELQTRFVEHLYKSDKQSINIVNILTQSNFISEVTTTPLLLTLFTITYNARQFKPDSLSEFYSLIFPTMLYRHDRMKIGFERERKADLNDYQMQRLFDSLSFLSLNDNNTRFQAPLFRYYLELSSKLEQLPSNIEDLLIDDITSITALVVRDGYDSYSFTHKSIQEYFAALFLSRLNYDKKDNFYQLLIRNQNEFRKWQNTLSFLETIDERNYTKLFLIPYKKNILCLNEKGSIKIKYNSLLQLIGKDSKVEVTEDGCFIDVFWGDTLSSLLYSEYSDFAKERILSYIKSKQLLIAGFLSFCDKNDYEKFQDHSGNFVFTFDKFFKENNLQKNISKLISSEFELSSFKQDVLQLEKALSDAERVTEEILPF